ncbi:hypothetical protein AK812_SmicGene46320, partial [Symbiodinium microadriaticum]
CRAEHPRGHLEQHPGTDSSCLLPSAARDAKACPDSAMHAAGAAGVLDASLRPELGSV